MSQLIISVSGLRGIVGDSLTPDVASRYVAAYVAGLPAGPIVVSRDGRASGTMLADIIRGTLAACGRVAIYADVSATPTTGVLVRQTNAAGGIQISASHNPPEYNGLKLFEPNGQVLPAELGQRVRERFDQPVSNWVDHQQIAQPESCADAAGHHLSLVLDTVNVDAIRAQSFRVLLDSNHGAGALLGRRLLEELGCQLTILGEEPNGQFWHTPEPTAANLSVVGQQVVAQGAQIGFCQDPDADRLAIIDEQGQYLGEEYTLAICLEHVLAERPGPVVTNCATSRMSQDVAERFGVPFHRAAVGEANVVAMMQQHEAAFGGEGNGGPIDPRVGYVRDSFVGMALVLSAMTGSEQAVSLLAASLPRYAIHKSQVSLPRDRIDDGLAALEEHFADAQADRMDGLRLDWPGSWLLVRPSNTEPIVRVIAEDDSSSAAEARCQQAAEVLRQLSRN